MKSRCANIDPIKVIIAPWVFFASAILVYLANHYVPAVVFLLIIGTGMAFLALYCLGDSSLNGNSLLKGMSFLGLIANILTIISFVLNYIFHFK